MKKVLKGIVIILMLCGIFGVSTAYADCLGGSMMPTGGGGQQPPPGMN